MSPTMIAIANEYRQCYTDISIQTIIYIAVRCFTKKSFYSKTRVSGMTPNWLVLLLNIELSLKSWRTRRMQDSIKTVTTSYSGKYTSNLYLSNRNDYKNDIVFVYINTTLQSRNVETFRRKRSPAKQDVCCPTPRREIDHD